jgi:D-tyrosyl-tRNA(Tyr) deacylase
MIGVIQRVSGAEVMVEGRRVSAIDEGILLLVGIADDDVPEDAVQLAEKTVDLRIFPDGQGRMNRSLRETGGAVLVVSQFTLLGDTRKGRRPSFTDAAKPGKAQPLYRAIIDRIRQQGIKAEGGVFGAVMEVKLTNNGPVTLIVNTRDKRTPKGVGVPHTGD